MKAIREIKTMKDLAILLNNNRNTEIQEILEINGWVKGENSTVVCRDDNGGAVYWNANFRKYVSREF